MNLTKPSAGLLAAIAACGAIAAPATGPHGIMSFANVNYLADPAATPATAQQDGVIAYRDPLTGKLTAPTPEQAAALFAAARPVVTPTPTAPVISHPAHGGISAMLGDKQMRYAMARKGPNGEIMHSCEADAELGEHHEK